MDRLSWVRRVGLAVVPVVSLLTAIGGGAGVVAALGERTGGDPPGR